MFQALNVFPGVTHITDVMGVSFTLIEGKEKAILLDTGYGLEDVNAYVRTLTDKAVMVLLSHGHHDHILGARWFEKTYLCSEDLDEFTERTGNVQRAKVMKQAEMRGAEIPPDFMTVVISLPDRFRLTEKTGRFDSVTIDLGGLTVLAVKVPGHTPGSIVLFIPEYNLLLTGDDWNPCTWMWFPSSVSARIWRENMNSLIRAAEKMNGSAISHVLCSHQPIPRDGREIKKFLAYMNDGKMEKASFIDMGAPINTHQITENTRGWTLVFDRDKII